MRMETPKRDTNKERKTPDKPANDDERNESAPALNFLQAIIADDPSMGGFVFGAVLNHDSFERALSQRLALRLGNAEISSELVMQAFEDALEAEPDTTGLVVRTSHAESRRRSRHQLHQPARALR